VRVSELARLLADRLDHRGVPVAYAGNCGAAGCVEIALARAVDEVRALPSDGDRILRAGMAVEHVIHSEISRAGVQTEISVDPHRGVPAAQGREQS
jgi:hypothetical protein